MKFTTLQTIAETIAMRGDIVAAIDAALDGESKPGWIAGLSQLRETAIDGIPRFSIIARKGNKKEPFMAFSSLPGAGFCPGAGDCLKFCYSFKSHRYPAAFCRQAQNSILMQSDTGRAAILADLDAAHDAIFNRKGNRPASIGFGAPVPFRLYVDGDFGSVDDVSFWFDALRERPNLACYGYSKSWNEIMAYCGEYPENYILNLSSGSKHSYSMRVRMSKLSITRGDFIAVNIGRKVKSSDHSKRAHQAELRKAYGKRAFTCPGQCGDCTPKGHACGSQRFANIPIIIAVH